MALLRCDFRSDVLQLSTSMSVILPAGTAPAAGHPTLWLLHGMSDDHTAWTRQTAVERYVADTGWAVVMPQVDRSYYADMAHGNDYWTFVSEELPVIARSMFRLSERRADNAAAGLSMGGYGAFKLALNFPDRYRAAASLSGALDPVGLIKDDPDRRRDWHAMLVRRRASRRPHRICLRRPTRWPRGRTRTCGCISAAGPRIFCWKTSGVSATTRRRAGWS